MSDWFAANSAFTCWWWLTFLTPTAWHWWQYSCLLSVLPHGPAGRGCGELETVPAVALASLVAPGGLTWGPGLWADRELPGVGTGGQGEEMQAGTGRPVRALTIRHEWLKFSDCTFDKISPFIPNSKTFLRQKVTDLHLRKKERTFSTNIWVWYFK